MGGKFIKRRFTRIFIPYLIIYLPYNIIFAYVVRGLFSYRLYFEFVDDRFLALSSRGMVCCSACANLCSVSIVIKNFIWREQMEVCSGNNGSA